MAGPTSALTETDPTQLGGYRLEGRLETSSLGVVYLGRDSRGEPVDVAVLNAGAGADPGSRQRFVDAVSNGPDVLSARTRGRAPLWVAVAHGEEGAGEYLQRVGQSGPVPASGPVVVPHWAGDRTRAVRWAPWDGRRGSSPGAGPGNRGLILALALLLLLVLLFITLLYWWMLQFPPEETEGQPESGPSESESEPPPEEGDEPPEGPTMPSPEDGDEGWGDHPEDNL